MTARVLIYDIENTPSLGYVWDKWNTNVIEMVEDWWMLCFAYKWLDEGKIHSVSQPDFAGYERDKHNDYGVVAELWHLFDEADIVVAHNGDRFDQAKSRARFAVHGFDPPSPYKEVDTKKIASRHFNFTSNSLNDLCRQFGIGAKGQTGGFSTWTGCMAGDPKSWARMTRYNRQDVALLEELYLKLRPWVTNHPNLALYGDRPDACPKCGGGPLRSKGWRTYQVARRRAFRCQACGGISYGRHVEKTMAQFVA